MWLHAKKPNHLVFSHNVNIVGRPRMENKYGYFSCTRGETKGAQKSKQYALECKQSVLHFDMFILSNHQKYTDIYEQPHP